jgi:DNA-binding transcriptional MocR family regulator
VTWPRNSNDTGNVELVWLIRRSLEADENTIFPGGGWLPTDWLEKGALRQSLNVLARRSGPHLHHYGKPYGYLPLREHLSMMMGDVVSAARWDPPLSPTACRTRPIRSKRAR